MFLNEKVDPVENLSARVRFVWEPSDSFRGDFRVAIDDLTTRALYFVVPRVDEANPFGGYVNDANDVDEPIQLDNPGINDRDLFNTSLKLDFGVGDGTLTSVTHYNTTEEILTGDAFDFRPAATSLFNAIFGLRPQPEPVPRHRELQPGDPLHVADRGQVPLDRGRLLRPHRPLHLDRQHGGHGHRRLPGATASRAAHRQQPERDLPGRLAGQRRLGRVRERDLRGGEKIELDVAVRYDEDKRENTTETPEAFPAGRHAARIQRPGPLEHTWSEPQPKITLRYEPTDNLTFYGGWSRGFRSGGFNQTGVGAVADASGIAGVNDLFEAEVAETTEIGVKSALADGRLDAERGRVLTRSRRTATSSCSSRRTRRRTSATSTPTTRASSSS